MPGTTLAFLPRGAQSLLEPAETGLSRDKEGPRAPPLAQEHLGLRPPVPATGSQAWQGVFQRLAGPPAPCTT